MDWLTEYLDLVMPVLIVLLYLVQRMFVRSEGEEEAGGAELDEEARRVQEEIRRKIVARQRGEDLPPPFPGEAEIPSAPFVRAPEPVPPPVPQSFPRTGWPESPQPAPVAVEPARNFLDELRAQKERLRETQLAKEEAVSRARSSQRSAVAERRRTVAGARVSARGGLREQLQTDLATSESLKRAFLLKEVLDRPVGLRESPDSFGNW